MASEHQPMPFSRTAGLTKGGQVLRGAPLAANAGAGRTFSSIPPKCYTPALSGRNSDFKGFGSVSKRFAASENDKPGPGTYTTRAILEPPVESVGKRGYGSLVSKSRRFSEDVLYTGPGPGEYRQQLQTQASFNITGSTSAFNAAAPGHMASSAASNATPGPGSYQASASTRDGSKVDWKEGTGGSGQRSAFKAVERRQILAGDLETPSPGAYGKVESWGVAEASHSAFKDGQGHRPVVPVLQPSRIPAKVPEIIKGDNALPQAGPGPGSYDTLVPSTFSGHPKPRGAQRSPAFAEQAIDRFGGRVVSAPSGSTDAGVSGSGDAWGPAPGPGTYSPASPPWVRPGRGAASAFVSHVPQHEVATAAEQGAAPGPAYYQPRRLDKKSFHLNAKKQYIA